MAFALVFAAGCPFCGALELAAYAALASELGVWREAHGRRRRPGLVAGHYRRYPPRVGFTFRAFVCATFLRNCRAPRPLFAGALRMAFSLRLGEGTILPLDVIVPSGPDRTI